MPTPARISVPIKQATPIKLSTITPKTPASIPRPKARVVHRRRPRRRLDDTDTDEDLVREPHSDDDSDSASSILDSESETVSESEPEPEPEPEEHEAPRVPSPSHTPLINGVASSSSSPSAGKLAVFPQSVDWSEMVAEENANGIADLPVIDFADLSSHTQPEAASATAAPSSPPTVPNVETSHETSAPRVPYRKPGQSARQAYLSRLDNDPAYVPTLGQFWSHDDRLLDKDLRSLSGWWRGRWQGRGRARGFGGGWGSRGMRGRGGFGSGVARPSHQEESQAEDAPPVERAWTHDGFEEMRKVDEERRQQQAFHGRGAFSRGRGSFRGGFSRRGGLAMGSNLPARAPSESQQSTGSDTLQFGTGTRPWFTMKPERMWTKQFDAYLYFEASLKPVHNQGLGQGVRVRLPGNKGEDEDGIVVRLPQRMASPPRPVSATKELPYGERVFVVKLPREDKTTKERNDTFLTPEDVFTVAPPPMEDPIPVFPSPRASAVETLPTKDVPITPARPPARRASESVAPSKHASTFAETAEAPRAQAQSPTPDEFATAGPSYSAPHTQPDGVQAVESIPPPPPSAPSFQTSAPQFQPSPPYGSPYGYAAPGLPLPPGIAVSESGVTYEIATGRAVFLHTPPPPPPPSQMQGPVYNPRPTPMHHAPHGSVHFLSPSHHAPGLSMSPPGFIASPPIFALPRQSSRVEIRAPGYQKGKERELETERPAADNATRSAVRSTVNVNAEPFTPAQAAPMGYYNSEGHSGFNEAQRHHHHASMAYQSAPYYYHLGPDGGAPYGYGQYAPMDVGQPQQYEQYAQDPYPQQQHTGYY